MIVVSKKTFCLRKSVKWKIKKEGMSPINEWNPLMRGVVLPQWMLLGIFWNHTCAIKCNLHTHTPAFQCLKKPGAIWRVALLRGIPSFSKYTSFGDDTWVLLRPAENHCNWPRITQPQLPQNENNTVEEKTLIIFKVEDKHWMMKFLR